MYESHQELRNRFTVKSKFVRDRSRVHGYDMCFVGCEYVLGDSSECEYHIVFKGVQEELTVPRWADILRAKEIKYGKC